MPIIISVSSLYDCWHLNLCSHGNKVLGHSNGFYYNIVKGICIAVKKYNGYHFLAFWLRSSEEIYCNNVTQVFV